jgi:hypothetical protein
MKEERKGEKEERKKETVETKNDGVLGMWVIPVKPGHCLPVSCPGIFPSLFS